MTDPPLLLELAVFAVAAVGVIASPIMLALWFIEERERRRGPYIGRLIGNVRDRGIGRRPEVVEHPLQADRRRTRFLLDALELLALAMIALAVLIGS